ncbi:uncharacterized protein LOC122860511 isoform X2 [Aphidius gifuensis]|uniref:uncharacterized protein LOC122860511 isoform X2 n=1 Tax=Aphidius gifuensis TaxID=684658 RepID=UPI001CDCA758|nr:uncharacterized protein LOC122860511 isoform X2 [Aphidius gifuensis]
MAKILNKDPITYERERDSFLKELHHFHETRGTSFKKAPKISGQNIDLYLLYVLVTAHGGWIKVNTRNEWSLLCEQFHLPVGCVNSGVGLKQIYLRYLDRYEKVHFLGEDGQQADDDDEDSRHRKWSARSLHSVPLTYNHHQHNVAETLRDYNGLSTNLYKPTNYDKLALSLLSPLPNEQDFAINVCTLLSNEGKHTLRFDKYPRLVNMLLAHAGVFDAPGTRQLFIEVYSKVRNYSINSFWSDVIDSHDILDLTNERIFMKKPTKNLNTFSRRKILDKEKDKLKKNSNRKSKLSSNNNNNNNNSNVNNNNNSNSENIQMEIDNDNNTPVDDVVVIGEEEEEVVEEQNNNRINKINLDDQNQNSIKVEDDDMDLFCMGRTLGTQDPYGQRVLQIASILRNLSFTSENAVVLGKNRCFLRFVLLCVRARWSNLHQLGFDILGNIANEIVLKDAGQRITDVIISCITDGINSSDRFVVISCLEILNKLSQQDCNEEVVQFGLTDNVYDIICRFLALSDIALLVYTLECLYALTSLGERPCTSIARVRGAIDTLVALVTVEAQSYGPKACILMRVVETVSTVANNNNITTNNNSTNNNNNNNNNNNSTTTITTNNNNNINNNNNTSSSNNSNSNNNNTSNISNNNTSTTSSSISLSSFTTTSTITNQQQSITQMNTSSTSTIAPVISVSSTASIPSISAISIAAAATPVTSPAPSRPTTPATPLSISKAAAKANEVANSLQQQHAHQQIIQENEQFALGWLRATFELVPNVKIEQEELYKKYLGCCTKIGRRGVIAPLHFPRCVRSVFGGTIGPNPMKGETTGTQYYEGIRVRTNPGTVTYPSQNLITTATTTTTGGTFSSVNNTVAAAASTTTTPLKVHPVPQRKITPTSPLPDSTSYDNSSKKILITTPASPILKAHLSAPPKPTTNISIQPQNPVTKVDSKSQVSVAHPHLSQALLASATQAQQQQQQHHQHQQQQQQQQQQQVGQDNRSGTTSSSIIKSLLATKVTISGDCMPSAAVATCVSTLNAYVTNTTTTSIASSISANQQITSNQVAQRQQQQRLLQQQLSGGIQPAAPSATLANSPVVQKTPVNSKQKNSSTPARKIQRLNGAKVVVTNNNDKTEVNDNSNSTLAPPPPQLSTVSTMTENHTLNQKIIRPSTIITNKINQRIILAPIIAEDSDSTNNSLASSSGGIGGSRDCSGTGAEEDNNSLTSFEGILLNGAPSNLNIDAQEDSKNILTKESHMQQSIILTDLLEKKLDKEPIINGVLTKNSVNEKLDIPDIKKIIKQEIKNECDSNNIIKQELLIDNKIIKTTTTAATTAATTTLQSRCIKRTKNDNESQIIKKVKYSNGTTSPNLQDTKLNIKSEEIQDDEKVTVSSTAANLYAALAADCIQDELDIDEPIKEEPQQQQQQQQQQISTSMIKEELPTRIINQFQNNQIETAIQTQPQQPQQQQQQQQQLIVTTAPRQIVVQQAMNNQMIISNSQIKQQRPQSQPQVLLQQQPSGQYQYVVSGGVPGQNYVLAQSQTALVQGQPQTVLVAQTTQQQGTGAKTIIILQPQTQQHLQQQQQQHQQQQHQQQQHHQQQQQTQKVVAVTPQGQQVVVTQVPRPLLQSSALGNIPPPLVPTSSPLSQASIIVNNNTLTQHNNGNTMTVTIPGLPHGCSVVNSVSGRVVTPTPASTPPPTRPSTPHQAASTIGIGVKQQVQQQQQQQVQVQVQQIQIQKQVQMQQQVQQQQAQQQVQQQVQQQQQQQQQIPVGKIVKNSTTSTSTSTSTSTDDRDNSKPSTSQINPTDNNNKTFTIKIDPNAFLCEWRGCLKQFKTPQQVYMHVCEIHCPNGSDETLCLWSSCDGLKRRRFSLMTHLWDKHCSAENMILRRKQLTTTGKTEIITNSTPATPNHPGYAPNAAFHAIKRHALDFVNPKELMDDNEGPVTKSIRLTAALILRNLVIYSAHGRRHLKAYEPHLAGVALSNVESSRTIAQVLYDMNEQTNNGSSR